MLKRPFIFGGIELPSNVFCAPLAGCSDLPFRRMTTAHRPGLVFCEMVKMDALVRHDPGTYRLLDYEADMHPIGAQLCGSKPSLAAVCARICEDLGFDVIDLNCGCPVDKVTKDGSGSGLLKTPEIIGDIIAEMVAAVKIPVTVKMRTGWDNDHINCVDICGIAKRAGASAACIHGRTRSQGYKGPADWSHIRACKEAFPEFCIIGNGDIFNAKAAEKIFLDTKCDAILVSRGTFGQPWIVEDIYRQLSGENIPLKDGFSYRDHLLEHMQHIIEYQPERKAVLDMRRVGCWYLKQAIGTRKLRESLNQVKTMEEIRILIENYAWHEVVVAEEMVEVEA
ncbi:MAG: tRNA dihydrouridine synthase DusB [Simkania sp.]|nr:tRNA dihydrouridine synthase DusB [Simkania sp.]